ncbi:MAG: DUF1361 domain-containing protein [Phormidesmis sp.]
MTHLTGPAAWMIEALIAGLSAAHRSAYFMIWNTFLALVPWLLSLWLFRFGQASRPENRTYDVRRWIWWIGCVLFVAFLPNAPYVLTDIIHLMSFIQEGASLPTVVLVLIPQYLLFMLIGMEAYVASLINLGHYLTKQGWGLWVLPAELTLHMLCAVGIYLGRFPRFNSWDIITGPRRLALYIVRDLLQPEPITIVLITFVVIAALYWPLKQITLAMVWYWRSPEGPQRLN